MNNLNQKSLPFTQEQLQRIITRYSTPFHIYDEMGIRTTIRQFKRAFAWHAPFMNYFAVKALPNPHILRIIKEEGFGVDCSSLPELVLAQKAGFAGEQIMFTSNETPAEEYRLALAMGAHLNLDDISHIDYLEQHASLPQSICFRYNPGTLREGNTIIGKPEEAKYGLTRAQLFEAYAIMKEKGVQHFGLHTMLASNELNPAYFVETAAMVFDLLYDISREVGIHFTFVNLGGGIGIPYRPEQKAFALSTFAHSVEELYQQKIIQRGLAPLKITMECGRFVTGPHGYLVTTALHRKDTYKNYIALDACMTNLMRPALYNAYHHITVMGKEGQATSHTYDIVGSLCENFDKFAIDRRLPEITTGDLVVLHDTGAHGHAMGFNYNGKLRSAELLLKADGEVTLIRRAETLEDYFGTLDFSSFG